jgi:hypothetical protein
VERAIYRAYEEVAAGFSSTWETWERFELEESETRDSGDSVLGLGRVKMRGSASHVELDQEFAVCVTASSSASPPFSRGTRPSKPWLAGWTTSRIWIEWVLADGRETRGWTRLAAVRPTGERPVISR